MSGGGGGGPTHTTSEVTQSQLPAYAEPYYKDLLARTGYESGSLYSVSGAKAFLFFSSRTGGHD